MRVSTVDPEAPDRESIERAAAILRGGGLVAFPTETVYGLGANALDEAAVRRIFTAKGRPSFNPLIVHTGDVAAASALAREWSDEAERLADRFWPGPLTLVVPKRGIVPDVVTAGLQTVALRVPSHPVAQALLHAAGVPVAAPSANRSTAISPTTAAHVLKGLRGRVDMVLDAGECSVGIESTVIDLSGTEPTLLRSGILDPAEIELVLGRPLRIAEQQDDSTARPSPGMMARHYAPNARLVLSRADSDADLDEETKRLTSAGDILGVILTSEQVPERAAYHVRLPAEPDGFARKLYAALHHLDDLGSDVILVQRVPDDPRWDGIRDRLRRASHPA